MASVALVLFAGTTTIHSRMDLEVEFVNWLSVATIESASELAVVGAGPFENLPDSTPSLVAASAGPARVPTCRVDP